MPDDGHEQDGRGKRWIGIAVAGAALAGLLLWIGWMVMPVGQGTRVATNGRAIGGATVANPATGGGGASVPSVSHAIDSSSVATGVRDSQHPEPVEMQPAVLFECYDHFRENVPPRNDTSVRQKDWTVPPTPLQLARAKLAGPKATPADAELLQWLTRWDAAWRQGRPYGAAADESLAAVLAKSTQPFETLFEIGRGMHYLEGPHLATAFYKAALGAAERDYAKDLSPVHPAAAALRASLPQLGFLWNAGDYATLERRFRLESAVHPPLSQESRKCMHSCAEAMFYQGKNKQAAELIEAVRQRNEQAGDLTESDRYEFAWCCGLFLSSAGRYEEAAPHFAVAADPGKYHSRDALSMLVHCLGEAGKTDEMQARMKEYNERYARGG